MSASAIYRRFVKLLRNPFRNPQALLAKAIKDGLPQVAIAPLRFVVDGILDPETKRVEETVEARRMEISTKLEGPIEIIYSPKPGSMANSTRPVEGDRLYFSAKRVANTGKDKFWGIFLHLIARETGARSAIELGACAGLSAYYLGLSPSIERLITIEGSSALADIARDTLSPLGERAHVITGLFNDVLDEIIPDCVHFDLAYIDGHHEKIATLNYFERLKPVLSGDAVVLFDDISWSQDMRDAWNEICAMPCISDCIDLGAVGVCLLNPAASRPRIWDLRQLSGVTSVGNPHGWDLKPGQVVE